MNMKLSELESKVRQLVQLGNKKLPVKLSYAINKNKKSLAAELETMLEQRSKIFEEKCLRDENGKVQEDENGEYAYENPSDKEAALSEFVELLNSETDIAIMTVPFAILERCDENSFDTLTNAEIEAIEFMIDE